MCYIVAQMPLLVKMGKMSQDCRKICHKNVIRIESKNNQSKEVALYNKSNGGIFGDIFKIHIYYLFTIQTVK